MLKGAHKKGSDLGIALLIKSDDDCTLLVSNELNETLVVPYQFDIVALGSVDSPELRAYIHRVGVVIYKKEYKKEYNFKRKNHGTNSF